MIGTYETFEVISRQISMKYHRDFFEIIQGMDLNFYFQLTKKEYDNLKFQNGTSSWSDYMASLENFLLYLLNKE